MSAPARATAVTGANGFVWRHVCRALAERGDLVRAIVRPGRAAPGEAEAFEVADLTDVEALREALDGADAVLHLAGRAHVLDDRAPDVLAEFRVANVHATAAVVRAARDVGVRHVVLVSSVAAAGSDEPDPRGLDGDEPTTPYGVSKLEAEALAVRLAAGTPTALTIVRPPMVYGPGMRGNPLRLFDLVARRVPLPIGGLRNRRSMLYVGNLAHALLLLLDHPECGVGPYYVADGEPVSTPAFARAAAAALGVRPLFLPVPTGLLRTAARGADLVGRRGGRPSAVDAVERLAGSIVVDDGPLRACTGYAPRWTPEEGLAETARWYRSRGATA